MNDMGLLSAAREAAGVAKVLRSIDADFTEWRKVEKHGD